MKYQTFANTTLDGGENHKKAKPPKPCQDRSWAEIDGDMFIAVVADGHGSDNCFRSEYGADFAVNAAKKKITTFITNLKGKELPLEEDLARQVKKLVGSIVIDWIYQVSEHYRRYPITVEDTDYADDKDKPVHFKGLKNFQVNKTYRDHYLQEADGGSSGKGGLLADDERPVTRHAYGATLIAAAVTKDFWFGIQIGDGKLTAFYPDGSYDQPVPWDDKCYLNVTTSICDDDAAERARVYVKKRNGSAASIDAIGAIKKLKGKPDMPSAVFLNSDGVDDSFPIEDNMDHMAQKFYYSVLRMFIEADDDPAKGWEAAVKELAEYLPELSKRGSGDDISVAGIIDMEAVKTELFCGALKKAKDEADKRRAREKEERENAIKVAEAARTEEAARKTNEKKVAAKVAEEQKALPKPTASQQSADDLGQEKAKKLKELNEAEEEKVRALNEIKEEQKKVGIELKEAVQLSQKKDTSEGDADIPASDAYKGQATKPQSGTKINTSI